MDHPNAIYFQVAADVVVLLLGVLFVASASNKGPYKATKNIPKWAKFGLGFVMTILGLVGLITHIGHFFVV